MKPSKGLLLAIDPGVNTGLVLFRELPDFKIVATETLVAPDRMHTDWQWRANYVCLSFWRFVQKSRPAKAYAERPEAFSSTTSIKGDQFKLDALAGMLAAICLVEEVPLEWIRVREWKGQLPKRVSTARTKRELGLEGMDADRKIRKPAWYPTNSHAWDALGIAVFVHQRGKGGKTR